MTLQYALDRLQQFHNASLALTVANIETRLSSADLDCVEEVICSFGIDDELLQSAIEVKKAAAQIDVILHALPHLLKSGEVVETLSLGAGNAGADFDLVTSHRIAEFKFIHWQGGADAVREKTLFQDFYKLVREPVAKQKYLYLPNTEIPLRFLRGNRDVLKALDRNRRLADDFVARYGTTYRTVGEFYEAHKADVHLVNLVDIVPEFGSMVPVTIDED
jgi:hypothetical protein